MRKLRTIMLKYVVCDVRNVVDRYTHVEQQQSPHRNS